MSAGADWSRNEVEATVGDYFDMLPMELRGESFNKAEHNRSLQRVLSGRTKGAIEMKHQNISAVLIELGFPYIAGYKPLSNFQKALLPEVVEERLHTSVGLQELVETVVTAPADDEAFPNDLLDICVPAPKSEPEEGPFRSREAPERVARVPRNYLEIEARNHSLGRAGEELVMRFEHQRLWAAGQKKLADQIEHVAKSRGDGLGYDIHSFETDGRHRLIEVKTTRFGPLTPFFASRNEVNFSSEQQDTFQLYRLFKFSEQPRLFFYPVLSLVLVDSTRCSSPPFLGSASSARSAKERRQLDEHFAKHSFLHTLSEDFDGGRIVRAIDLYTHQLFDLMFSEQPRTERSLDERTHVDLVIGPYDCRNAR